MMKIVLTILVSLLPACMPDEHKPDIFNVGVCIDEASVTVSVPEGTTQTSTSAPNCNARCVYTTQPTTIYCLDHENDLVVTKEVHSIPSAGDGLIKYEECCPINAKRVAINPVVPGHYIDRDCHAHNFQTIVITNPNDDPDSDPNPDTDMCTIVGGEF